MASWPSGLPPHLPAPTHWLTDPPTGLYPCTCWLQLGSTVEVAVWDASELAGQQEELPYCQLQERALQARQVSFHSRGCLLGRLPASLGGSTCCTGSAVPYWCLQLHVPHASLKPVQLSARTCMAQHGTAQHSRHSTAGTA